MRIAASIVRATAGVFVLALITLGAAGCNGFGTTDITLPGNTPNIPPQNSFRFVGRLGTPFVAKIADTRSSWTITGVVPLNVVIVNNSPPVRIAIHKLTNDDSLLSVEVITGLTVKQLGSTVDRFGLSVGNWGSAPDFPPKASPDVRFFIKGPAQQIVDAMVEDEQNAYIVETTAPALILFDSPAGGTGTRVDATFTEVGFLGGLSIDLIYNNVVVQSVFTGTEATLKFP